MEHAIRFRHSIEALDAVEFNRFVMKISQKQMIKFVFNHFVFQLTQCKTQQHLEQSILEMSTINQMIDKIVLARKKSNDETKSQDTETQKQDLDPLNLKDLPYCIISHCASFLRVPDLVKFERCSRTTFIGSRSPAPSFAMSQDWFLKCILYYCAGQNIQINDKPSDYPRSIRHRDGPVDRDMQLDVPTPIYQFHRFSNTESSLKMDAHDDCYSRWGKLPIFKNIKTFELEASDFGEFDFFIKELNDARMHNVTHFKFESGDQVYFNSKFLDDLFAAVNRKKRLEYVMIDWGKVISWAGSDGNPLFTKTDWVQQLRGLAASTYTDTEYEIELMKNIYPQLNVEILESFHSNIGCFPASANGKLDNLKEICFPYNGTESFKDIDFLKKQSLDQLDIKLVERWE